MKDNYAPEGEETLSEFMERMRDQPDQRVERIKLIGASMFGVIGFGMMCWFDWRLGVGIFMLWWSHNISKMMQ